MVRFSFVAGAERPAAPVVQLKNFAKERGQTRKVQIMSYIYLFNILLIMKVTVTIALLLKFL